MKEEGAAALFEGGTREALPPTDDVAIAPSLVVGRDMGHSSDTYGRGREGSLFSFPMHKCRAPPTFHVDMPRLAALTRKALIHPRRMGYVR